VRSTCSLRRLRIHSDLEAALPPGRIHPTRRRDLETCLVELAKEAEVESRAASPLEPDLTVPERKPRRDLERHLVVVAARSESFLPLINVFANKLSLLTNINVF
jgi:hypothetical protein